MERIQRALEISRLQRAAPAEATPAPAAATPARAARAEPSAPLLRHAIDAAALRRRRVLLADDPGTAGRAYRMLRAQLLQRARAARARVFGIVSAVSGEGKTLTAINLALSLAAEPNQSVALIDLDLRHPSIAQTLGIAPASGLDSWLPGEEAAAAVLCELEGIARLTLAPTLASVAASSETLASARTRELVEELKAADAERIVLIDLPPALLSDDVLTAVPLLDGVILVVTEGKTRREDVERVIELVGRARIVGTVLNSSSSSELRAY